MNVKRIWICGFGVVEYPPEECIQFKEGKGECLDHWFHKEPCNDIACLAIPLRGIAKAGAALFKELHQEWISLPTDNKIDLYDFVEQELTKRIEQIS